MLVLDIPVLLASLSLLEARDNSLHAGDVVRGEDMWVQMCSPQPPAAKQIQGTRFQLAHVK